MDHKNMAKAYLQQLRENLHAEVYERFRTLMDDFLHHRVTIKDILVTSREIFKGHKSLLLGFNAFLPEKYRIILTEDEPAMKFVNKVKTRFEDDVPAYHTFVRILQMYSQEQKTIIEVYEEIAHLFGNHDDLLAEFITYLPDTSPGDNRSISPSIHERKKRKINDERAEEICLPEDSSQSSRVEIFSSSNNDCNGLKSFEKSGKNVAFAGVDATSSKYAEKSVEQHCLSKCEQITPSYKLLPVDFPVAENILNNYCECKPPGNGSGDGLSRKTAHEKMLFLYEDIRFEIDMFMGRLKSTIERAEKLLEKIRNNEVGADPVLCLKDYFEDRNLMCIEKLYNESGLGVLELLRDDAPRVLPIILRRLIQKKAEWAQHKADFNLKCADILARKQRRIA